MTKKPILEHHVMNSFQHLACSSPLSIEKTFHFPSGVVTGLLVMPIRHRRPYDEIPKSLAPDPEMDSG